MLSWEAATHESEQPPRRVREAAKDGVAVAAASALASTALAVGVLLISKLAG
ncbi:MAG: hypothetical protein H0U61_06055 [Nocardioidaceae bacterium]|nr:hypothetical protein [Nocardioidaceae bacterium]